MSRLRWPDSTNSVSDVPGTIQTNAVGILRPSVRHPIRHRQPPPHAPTARSATGHDRRGLVVCAWTPADDAVGTACGSQGRLRCVVMHDVARLARSAPALEAILRTFREAGVECVPITEGTRDA